MLPKKGGFQTLNALYKNDNNSKEIVTKKDLLKKKLVEVDKALTSLRSNLTTESSLLTSKSEKDLSFVIDTTSQQLTSCPKCFKEIRLRDMRSHINNDCEERIVTCTENGCGAVMSASKLASHLATGCLLVKKRNTLVIASVTRVIPPPPDLISINETKAIATSQQDSLDATCAIVDSEADVDEAGPPPIGINREEKFIECFLCKDMVKESSQDTHSKECKMRLVYCPNKYLGCNEEIAISTVNQHLKLSCAVERRKEELVARSHQRQEPVKCTGCGEMVPFMNLRKHQSELCDNRRVPCRNWAVGCQVMVRLRDRKKHENVDNLKVRPCMYFNGDDVHAAIEEDDIPPPWTAEYWVYRPTLRESAKHYLAESKRYLALFLEAALAECTIRNQVLAIVQTLRSGGIESNASGGRPAEVSLDIIKEIIGKLSAELDVILHSYENAAIETITMGRKFYMVLRAALTDLDMLRVTENGKEVVDIDDRLPTGTLCAVGEARRATPYSQGQDLEDLDLQNNDSNEMNNNDIEVNEMYENEPTENGDEEIFTDGDVQETDFNINSRPPTAASSNNDDSRPQSSMSKIGKQFSKPATPVQMQIDEAYNIPGFEAISCKVCDLIWTEQSWDKWRTQVLTLINRLAKDEAIAHEWRCDCELIERKKEKGQSKGNSKDNLTESENEHRKNDIENNGKEDRKAKREKREKKLKNKQLQTFSIQNDKSKFIDRVSAIYNLYQGSETLSSSEYGRIFMNTMTPPLPSKSNHFSGNGTSSSAIIGTEDGSKKNSNSTVDAMQGRIGFSDVVGGVHAFDVTIPRGQWCHVAIVCTDQPKKRMYMYYDGVLSGTVKDISLNLPMKNIGASDVSFLGYVLDIRYWSKARSVPEIKQGMHSLVDLNQHSENVTKKSSKESNADQSKSNIPKMDLSSDGLIAWWTFEEGGRSRRLCDVTDQRFAIEIKGKYAEGKSIKKVWYEAATIGIVDSDGTVPPAESSLPTPSFMERNLCPFEVRRLRLSQRARDVNREVKCPLGCKIPIRKAEVRFHVQNECLRRRIVCNKIGCGMLMIAAEVPRHYAVYCEAMLKQEKLLKQEKINNALEECPYCSEMIKVRHMHHHFNDICPHRHISCPEPGCGMEFPANTLKHHLKYKCQGENVKKKMWLIHHARTMRNYPRPWGIEMNYNVNDATACTTSTVEATNNNRSNSDL